MAGKDLGDGPVGDPAFVFGGGDLLGEAGIEEGAGSRVHDIPHFRLSPEAGSMEPGRQRIVRMDLDGEVSGRIDEFDKKREGFAGEAPDQAGTEAPDQFVQCRSVVGTALDNGYISADSGELPTLPDVGLGGLDALERCDSFTAPDDGFQDGGKT